MPTTDTGLKKPSNTPAVVIYNGPSRAVFLHHEFPGYVLGCNFAYRDFKLTHCWAVDRMTVAAIRGELETLPMPCEFWTKLSVLELPPDWQHAETPGIDSGSAALQHALKLTDREVIVIGCDGICGGATTTAYQYPWHGNSNKRHIHHRHRNTVLELHTQNPNRIKLVWPHALSDLDTIDHDQAIDLIHK
jgi:hypothetical protein